MLPSQAGFEPLLRVRRAPPAPFASRADQGSSGPAEELRPHPLQAPVPSRGAELLSPHAHSLREVGVARCERREGKTRRQVSPFVKDRCRKAELLLTALRLTSLLFVRSRFDPLAGTSFLLLCPSFLCSASRPAKSAGLIAD